MQHLIKSYLKFIWNSTNAHGVHSPFVYDLVQNCLYDKTNYSEYETLVKYRNAVLQNKNTIEVTDFGAGSQVFKSNTRAIDQIAKNAGISVERAKLLFRIVNYFQPKSILEIGTSVGLATSALSLNDFARVTTLERCSKALAIAKEMFQFPNFNLQQAKVNFVTAEISDFLKSQSLKYGDYNLIYFDGNHSKAATLDYFELLLPTITNESIWIFDNIHQSKEMEDLWELIKKNPKVTVTIDTFQWGLVFFRSEQVKEDFIVRTDKSFLFDKILGIKNGWGLLH
jgi:predicted O-methyltransferase YrrM